MYIWGDAKRFNQLHKGANCKLLIHSDTTDGSTTFVDTIGTHSPTAGGGVQHDTAQKMNMGASTILFDGDEDYITIADHVDFYTSNLPFTLDFWVRFNTTVGIHTFYIQKDATAADHIWFFVDHSTGRICFHSAYGDSSVFIRESGAWVPAASTWYHVALIRGWGGSSSSWAICVDGIAVHTFTNANQMYNNDQAVLIGGMGSAVDSLTTLYDFSDSAHVLVTSNGWLVDAADKKFGERSIVFNGADDYISIPDSADWDILTTTDVTISLWVKHSDHVGTETYIAQAESDQDYWSLSHVHGTGLVFQVETGNSVVISCVGKEIADLLWHHVVLVKGGTGGLNYAIYLDGVQVGFCKDNSTDTYAASLFIGSLEGTAQLFDGYIDDLFVSHSDVFTAKTYWWALDDVIGQAGVSSAPQISTGTYKFGNACILFDGTDDYVYHADSVSWDILSQTNFTIDLWVKHIDHVGSETYMTQYEDADNYWYISHTHGTGLAFTVFSAAAPLITMVGGEISNTSWHHVAVCKVGSNYGIYLDGVQTAYVGSAATDTFAATMCIGSDSGATAPFSGYMDEVRLDWANSFTASPVVGLTDTIAVPSAAHSATANTKMLMHFNADTISVPTTPYVKDSDTKLLLHPDGYDLDGWMTEIRLVNGTAMWTSTFRRPIGRYA